MLKMYKLITFFLAELKELIIVIFWYSFFSILDSLTSVNLNDFLRRLYKK